MKFCLDLEKGEIVKKLLLGALLVVATLLTIVCGGTDYHTGTGKIPKSSPEQKSTGSIAVSPTQDIDKEGQALDLGPVWSGVGVRFDLLTYRGHQFAAFYDEDRYLTVASRKLNERFWIFKRLSTQIGWDAHNSITMAIDDRDQLHVAGNMHGSPLTYFRTISPLDIKTLVKIDAMLGSDEDQVTYPKFFRGPRDKFLFSYRQGASGSGTTYINVYNHTTQTWERLVNEPLFGYESMSGTMNAYPHGPIKDRDDVYHMVWIWRDTGRAETNHDISYARSRDLVHWENSRGELLALPLTIANAEIVDPVPVGGGAINNNVKVGFDAQNHPIVSYHKYDADGNTQIYNARLENGEWKIYQTTQWTDRWDFSGGGTLRFLIELGEVTVEADGGLNQAYSHWKEGSGIFHLDPNTLEVIGTYPPPDRIPPELRIVESTYQCKEGNRIEGMKVFILFEQGSTENYFLRWEALESDRDRARICKSPIPSTMLRLYTVVHKSGDDGVALI